MARRRNTFARTFECASLLLAGVISHGSLAAAQGAPDGFESAGVVVRVVSGAEVVTENGAHVRLADLWTPEGSPGGGALEAEAGARARAALAEWTLGRRVRMAAVGEPDRYGRRPAQLHLVDPESGGDLFWVQWELVRAGRAFFAPDEATRAGVAEALLRAERRARAVGLGLWALSDYAVASSEEAGGRVGRFALVEGRVRAVAEIRGRVFLNFGEDWRSDFTITVPPDAAQRFTAAGIALTDYEGAAVRVRGFVESYNGPSVEVRSPYAIERLKDGD